MFDKNGNLIEINHSVSHFTRPKKRFRNVLFFVSVLVLLTIGYFAYGAVTTLGKITSGSGETSKSPLAFLGKIKNTGLRGENEGRVNILLLGIGGQGHPGGQLTDTIMIASIDTNRKKIALISIPRDLYVPISGQNIYAKINTAHSIGETNSKTGGGAELSKKTVSEVFNLPIHYFVRLDFSGFVKLVDTLGGITVNVEKPIYDPYFPAVNMRDYQPFKISAGVQKLDGQTALKYARSRETTSDFDRARRQQQVLSAIRDKTLSSKTLTNPVKVTEILKILGEHVRTDLTLFDIERLMDLVKKSDTQNIITKVFDSSAEGLLTSSSGSGGGYYLKPRTGNFKELQQAVKNIFIDSALQNSAEGNTKKAN